MSKIIIATKLINGQPVLPPFQAEDGGPQLHYNIVEGIPQSGGWSVIGPGAGKTVMVMVDVSEEVATAMKADTAYLPMDTTNKGRAIAWIATNTDTKGVDLAAEILGPVLAIHGLDKPKYESLIGTPWANEVIVDKKIVDSVRLG